MNDARKEDKKKVKERKSQERGNGYSEACWISSHFVGGCLSRGSFMGRVLKMETSAVPETQGRLSLSEQKI